AVEDVQRGLGAAVLDAVLAHPGVDLVQRVVDNALGDGLLAVLHHAVDELGQHPVVETRVGAELGLGSGDAACHGLWISWLICRVVPAVCSPAWRRLLASKNNARG